MNKLLFFVLFLLLVVSGCVGFDSGSDFPVCYYINVDDGSVVKVVDGSENVGLTVPCTQVGVKGLMDEYVRTKAFGVSDEYPVGDYSVRSFVRLWGYHRGGLALVWDDSLGVHCSCIDSSVSNFPDDFSITSDCLFVREFLSDESVFDVCFE